MLTCPLRALALGVIHSFVALWTAADSALLQLHQLIQALRADPIFHAKLAEVYVTLVAGSFILGEASGAFADIVGFDQLESVLTF